MKDENKAGMPLTVAPSTTAEPDRPMPGLWEQMRAFLDGRTHGEALLHAIHDRVLDEPIPARMRSILRRQ